ncbi:MAG: hypothetical protein AUK44_10580 [Porphyromonadaceae bacterium CG2_30_38_12]|nr:MAG: hypothetical protein AUK44_10580 [Porphyromonadaceae bacterium CG2_30_38_12]
MKKLALLGRILFAIPIAAIGISHFLMTPAFLERLSNSLIPGNLYTVMLAGAMLIIASIFIVLNKYVKVACLWLAGMLLVIITAIHLPNLFVPAHFDYALMEILQDTALMGAALMIAYYLDKANEDEAGI